MPAQINTPTNLHFRIATLQDALPLSAIALQTFIDTYAADNDPANTKTHCDQYFGEAQQSAEINDPQCIYLLAFVAQQLVGYALIKNNQAPSCIQAQHAVCLSRFYIIKEWHGKGIAAVFMEEVLKATKQFDAQHLWLTMWEHNHRAKAYYKKAGFSLVGETEFYFGNEIQKDFVFEKPIK